MKSLIRKVTCRIRFQRRSTSPKKLVNSELETIAGWLFTTPPVCSLLREYGGCFELLDMKGSLYLMGAEIVGLLKTGSAYFAPSSAAATMVKSIVSNSNEVMPACSWVDGEFGINALLNNIER